MPIDIGRKQTIEELTGGRIKKKAGEEAKRPSAKQASAKETTAKKKGGAL